MGQAKQRGTFEQRLAQANVANAKLKLELTQTHPDLLRLMNKHGVQKFRMSMGMHLTQDEQQHQIPLQAHNTEDSKCVVQAIRATEQVEQNGQGCSSQVNNENQDKAS